MTSHDPSMQRHHPPHLSRNSRYARSPTGQERGAFAIRGIDGDSQSLSNDIRDDITLLEQDSTMQPRIPPRGGQPTTIMTTRHHDDIALLEQDSTVQPRIPPRGGQPRTLVTTRHQGQQQTPPPSSFVSNGDETAVIAQANLVDEEAEAERERLLQEQAAQLDQLRREREEDRLKTERRQIELEEQQAELQVAHLRERRRVLELEEQLRHIQVRSGGSHASSVEPDVVRSVMTHEDESVSAATPPAPVVARTHDGNQEQDQLQDVEDEQMRRSQERPESISVGLINAGADGASTAAILAVIDDEDERKNSSDNRWQRQRGAPTPVSASVKMRHKNYTQCTGCGIQTHEIHKRWWGRDRHVPLTKVHVFGEHSFPVLEGRCLACNPPTGSAASALPAPAPTSSQHKGSNTPSSPPGSLSSGPEPAAVIAEAPPPPPFSKNNIELSMNNPPSCSWPPDVPVSPQPLPAPEVEGVVAATITSPTSVTTGVATTMGVNAFSAISTTTTTAASTVFVLDHENSPKHDPQVDTLRGASTPSQIVEALNRLNQQISRSANNPVHEQKCVGIVAAGGIHAILMAMQEHPNDAELQLTACRALQSLACSNKNEVAICQAPGGIQAILMAMKTHPSHAKLQLIACAALWSLSCNNENQVAIGQAPGGIAAILAAMEAHPNHAELQRNACRALLNLARNNDNRIEIAKAGGVAAIEVARKSHPVDAGVQDKAQRVLRLIQG